MKVRIESITIPNEYEPGEKTKIFLDGELIIEGRYGGEPEDNARYRDYNCVESAFFKLAEKLGAEVEFVDKEEKEED